MISGLTKDQKQAVVEETTKYIQLASELYQTDYRIIPVKFDLTGHTIGMYKRWRNKKLIRYNSLIFSKYFKENLQDTVPHEVAHYIVDMQFSRKKVSPHGVEWRSIMQKFGADDSRTARYDLSDIPKRRYSTVPYQCDCQTHHLGIRRHNKVIQHKTNYFCRQCGNLLKALV